MKVEFIRIKGLTQEKISKKIAEQASQLLSKGYKIISITQFDGGYRGGTIYYTKT